MFEPKADKAQWQIVYDYLSTMQIGDVIKYDELADLLPDAPEASVRGAYRRALREIEENDQRSFANIRLVGYRMVEAAAHERLARDQHRSAKRRLKAARRKAHAADRSLLSQQERQRIDAVEMNLAQQQDMISRLSGRVERIDKDLKAARREHKSDAAEQSARIDRLTELLERHGITEDQHATS